MARREQAGKSWILNPVGNPFGLGSVWSQWFHSRLLCLESHRMLCAQSGCFTHCPLASPENSDPAGLLPSPLSCFEFALDAFPFPFSLL